MLPEALQGIRSPDMGAMLDALEKNVVPARDVLLLDTLGAAYREAEQLSGGDPKIWRWGRLHHSLPAHPLLHMVEGSARDRLQVGPFPKSGGPFTPNQSGYRQNDFLQTGGPSFRVVMDVGNWDNSRAVNYPGQSGDPDGPHYRDLASLWLKGEYFPLLYTRSAIARQAKQRIVLVPAKPHSEASIGPGQ
jgi:penicillin amidase